MEFRNKGLGKLKKKTKKWVVKSNFIVGFLIGLNFRTFKCLIYFYYEQNFYYFIIKRMTTILILKSRQTCLGRFQNVGAYYFRIMYPKGTRVLPTPRFSILQSSYHK